jgi:ATP-binding cassette subfamily F protein uup
LANRAPSQWQNSPSPYIYVAMSELILSIEDAMVLIGGKPFFENLTFHIHKGRKIALVGKNGAGKTTLMNLITGDREIDDGRRWLFAGTTIGYMQQHIDPLPGQTIRDFVFAGMKKSTEDWDQSYKIEMIVEPLGLDANDRMDSLSGGLLRRACLARALVEEPDILLLDEPTNHMDLEVIQWLETYLKYYAGAVICVSHDRTFLANISDNVFWLDRGKLRVSPEGFGKFDEWSQSLYDLEARQLQNREQRVKLELEWANRGVKARVKRNVRRQSLAREAASQLEADQKSYKKATRAIKFPPPDVEESSLNVAEFINAKKSFINPDTGVEKLILDKFTFRVKRRDRVGILGRNGSGKTSFLKLLVGELQADGGKVKMAKDLTFSYFDQKRSTLDNSLTLQDTLCVGGNDHLDVRGKYRHVCGYLKDFLFEPEDAWRKVSTLSGGQKNRLMLAKVLANPGSFLILDEPTNDLDMDTLDMLENILTAFDGTIFVVSHDRDFLDQVVNKLLVFEGDGKIETIIGGYSDYLEYKKGKEPPAPKIEVKNKKEEKKSAASTAPTPNKVASKLSYKLQYELDRLPRKIKEYETEFAELQKTMADPDLYSKDPGLFYDTAKRHAEIKETLDVAENRWLELEDMRMKLEDKA